MSEPGMNDSSADDINPSNMHGPLSPGAQLAGYRKERGWTVEQVASQLNLAPRQVVAIESDDYPSLPGMPITRGFIRAYAKLLKVDAAPLLAPLGGETVLAHDSLAPRQTLSTPFAERRLPSIMTDRPVFSSKWVVGALVAVLLGVAIWAAQQSSEVTELQKSAATQVKDGLASLSGSDQKPQGTAAEKPQPAAPASPDVESNNAPSPSPAAPVAPAPDAQATTPQVSAAQQQTAAPAAAPAGESAAPATKDVLVLKAREESWIEVRRIGGKRAMVSRLMKPGETETVDISEPVTLVVGNASGVDATLRGEPLEFKTVSGNVARITLK